MHSYFDARLRRSGRRPGPRGGLIAVIVVSIAQFACAAVDPVPDTENTAALDSLPPGAGRAILSDACTGCHNLEGLWAYQGYYDERRWRGLVDTMIAHGATLDETEASALVDYLVEHFGPGTR